MVQLPHACVLVILWFYLQLQVRFPVPYVCVLVR
jgi:hypothetical protein